jgi:uncharacterized protein (DUF427 family)
MSTTNKNRIPPGPGQESVWDYPRPPRVEDCPRRVKVVFRSVVVADSRQTKRVLETSHPPVYYIPPDDIRMDLLLPSRGSSFCEWKGRAQYYHLQVDGSIVREAAWYYPDPVRAFVALRDHVAFYPSRVDACYVDEELVRSQEGDFYGGWITDNIVGPFKGAPGTNWW